VTFKEPLILVSAVALASGVTRESPELFERTTGILVALGLGMAVRFSVLLWRPKLPVFRRLIGDVMLSGAGSVVVVSLLRAAREGGVTFIPNIPEIEWSIALISGYAGSKYVFDRAIDTSERMQDRLERRAEKELEKKAGGEKNV
jgi:hypothetical protein